MQELCDDDESDVMTEPSPTHVDHSRSLTHSDSELNLQSPKKKNVLWTRRFQKKSALLKRSKCHDANELNSATVDSVVEGERHSVANKNDTKSRKQVKVNLACKPNRIFANKYTIYMQRVCALY